VLSLEDGQIKLAAPCLGHQHPLVYALNIINLTRAMLRIFVASAVIVFLFGTTGWGQAPSATTTPTSPAIAKKPAAKAKPGTKQPAVVETGLAGSA
jgi:hypothetical protein